ncbi:hypothetical protein CERZMDRAFT_86542 [Cercospora zeae-maydis SCOH1-5]|uniref:Thioesterase domain-containing protein n=1 Tax=Cercospora zeae-maydis SCOH1-5 TaxID=717836 RepID=A0A6A6F928_9PEZI|nr:hypothetical protein CERZMDRAFT_86542 [Cercospora zeae-maydis SCOH1-5]
MAMADLLTDPLLSMAISARLKRELQLDISADDLVNLKAIGDLKTTLLGSRRQEMPFWSAATSPSDRSNSRVPATLEDLALPMRFAPKASGVTKSTDPLDSPAISTPLEKMACLGTPSSASIATPLEELKPWEVTPPPISRDPSTSMPTTMSHEAPSAIRPATSVVMQGQPRPNTRAVFLFPDGSGSERAYANLPPIGLGVVVYGLQCPFLKRPADLICSWDELVQAYISEIQRRQPRGPYDFAGYAAGGALAFRAAQLLVVRGEQVNSMTLINSPVPDTLGHLSNVLYEYIRSVLEWRYGGHIPEWVLPHLKAFTKILNTYRQSRCAIGAVKNLRIMWAGRGVSDEAPPPPTALSEGEKSVIKFLTEARHDFGPCGWEMLLPGSETWCGMLDADHFEMMPSRRKVCVTNGHEAVQPQNAPMYNNDSQEAHKGR